jgi:hypothetical protein
MSWFSMITPKPAPLVAISYAHGPRDQVCLDLADRSRAMGVDCEIDAYEDAPAEGWGRWMTRMMSERVVLMVCDETYYRRFNGKSDPGVGLGLTFESGLLVRRFVESQGHNDFLYPLLHDGDDSRWIPEFLRDTARFRIPDEYERLYRVLTNNRNTHVLPSVASCTWTTVVRGFAARPSRFLAEMNLS